MTVTVASRKRLDPVVPPRLFEHRLGACTETMEEIGAAWVRSGAEVWQDDSVELGNAQSVTAQMGWFSVSVQAESDGGLSMLLYTPWAPPDAEWEETGFAAGTPAELTHLGQQAMHLHKCTQMALSAYRIAERRGVPLYSDPEWVESQKGVRRKHPAHVEMWEAQRAREEREAIDRVRRG